jgi:hypothetical protein
MPFDRHTAVFDCRYLGNRDYAPMIGDWTTLESDDLYDLASTDALGDLNLLPADLVFMWVQFDCSDCAADTYMKLGSAGAIDSTTNTFVIPAGERFTLGVTGMIGAGGYGIQAISLKMDMADTIHILAQLDTKN